jgi:hypothetical protein
MLRPVRDVRRARLNPWPAAWAKTVPLRIWGRTFLRLHYAMQRA